MSLGVPLPAATDTRLPRLYARIVAESFTPLGWFAALPRDGLPHGTKSVVLIGNAGLAMFERFSRERDPEREQLDLWTREIVDRLAASLGAGAAHPCDTCADKPCLASCPVTAFDGSWYDVAACVGHLGSDSGRLCLSGGCLARRACPVGREFAYGLAQAQFHMRAFVRSQVNRA